MYYDDLSVIKFGWKYFSVYFETDTKLLSKECVCSCGRSTVFRTKVNVVEIFEAESMVEVDINSSLGKRISFDTKTKMEKILCYNCSLLELIDAEMESFSGA